MRPLASRLQLQELQNLNLSDQLLIHLHWPLYIQFHCDGSIYISNKEETIGICWLGLSNVIALVKVSTFLDGSSLIQ